MPTREAAKRAAELREQAKTDPALAAVLRKRRKAAKKAAAKRMAVAATAADVTLAQLAADLAPGPAQAPTDPATPLTGRHAGIAKARAAMAAKRAAAEAAGTPLTHSRTMPAPGMDTFVGRIDLKLRQLGKNRREMERVLSIPFSSIARWARDGEKPRPDRMLKIAEYLGVTVSWLKHGEITPDSVAAKQQLQPLVPHTATVFKANGKAHHASHEGRVEHAMTQNIDTTITVLWSLLPMDAKVMVIARVAELVAMSKR